MRNGLHVRSIHSGPRPKQFWWRKYAFAIRLASCFFSITLATVYVQFFERSAPTVNLIWVANGLLLTYLLLAPRWRWWSYLIAGTAAAGGSRDRQAVRCGICFVANRAAFPTESQDRLTRNLGAAPVRVAMLPMVPQLVALSWR